MEANDLLIEERLEGLAKNTSSHAIMAKEARLSLQDQMELKNKVIGLTFLFIY